MLERDGYIAGVPCWIDTNQPDPGAAVGFYGELFGWEFEDVMPPGSPSKYIIARLRGGDVAAVASAPEGAATAVWNTYIWVDSADETAAKIQGAGGNLLTDPFDVMDAGRMASCSDLEGAVFYLWEARAHKGARIVNEPGSLNFNGLSTRDPDRAKEFYGAVFGWETMDFGGGAQGWRLPGYGDFLEGSDPGLRERMAQAGAPEGFADVVATLNPIAEDQRGMPAQWGITFAVADADTTAKKAAELGGQVLVAPFDAPWVRMTVIADPQGATFVASKFVPESRHLGSEALGAA